MQFLFRESRSFLERYKFGSEPRKPINLLVLAREIGDAVSALPCLLSRERDAIEWTEVDGKSLNDEPKLIRLKKKQQKVTKKEEECEKILNHFNESRLEIITIYEYCLTIEPFVLLVVLRKRPFCCGIKSPPTSSFHHFDHFSPTPPPHRPFSFLFSYVKTLKLTG